MLPETLFSRERILEYKSNIVVELDGTIEVTEEISVFAEGRKIKRGIFRDFPTRYRTRAGNNVKVDFIVEEVLRDGSPEPYLVENISNGKSVKIGNKNVFLRSGKHTYTLKYKTNRQIGFFENFDELYFNAIGLGWIFPIDKAVITLTLPEGSEIIQHTAYTGSRGRNDNNYNSMQLGNNVIRFKNLRPFAPRTGLSFAVAWPKGIIKEPSKVERTSYFLRDNASVLFFLIGLIILLNYYFYAWNKVGRDPQKGPIVPIYKPPENFSPAAVRYLLKMSFDKRCFTAAIVNMARKGYLDIIEDDDGYKLSKKNDDKSILTKGETALAKQLFHTSDTITLDNKEHRRFRCAIRELLKALKKELSSHYFKSNSKWLYPGFLFISIPTLILIILFMPDFTPTIIICIIVIILVNLFFAYLMQAPTLLGRKTMDEIEGFKMYLSVAEAERMNLLNPPDRTPELFEIFLPYAIALKVENEWGDQFNSVFSKLEKEGGHYQPSWYHGHHISRFGVSNFTSSVGKSFSSAISSASSSPGSSSASGGGGGAGGGGGGGGGGGW